MLTNAHLYLFDISSNFSRNYFRAKKGTIPDDGYKNGVPVFAVASTIFQVFKEMREASQVLGSCSHLLLALDPNEKTFRHEIYQDYKANREPKEDDFYIQKDIFNRLINHLKLPNVVAPRYEADDIIKTVSTKVSSLNGKVTIFTKDKDIFALVDENVKVFSGQESIVYDIDQVIASKGVHPRLIQDLLCLEGDVADNIKGIDGAGPVAAKQILDNFKLDDVLNNPSILEDTKIRTRKRIIKYINENQDFISLMRDVIRMRDDVSLNSNLSSWKIKFEALNDRKRLYDMVHSGLDTVLREI